MFLKGSCTHNMVLFVKGMLMGLANKVPGVSGGAVAYVLGFHYELICSFQKVNRTAFSLLFKRGFKSFYNYINGSFLLFILAGMVFSYFTISRLLDFFLINYELYVWCLFFGMIIGSAIYLINKYKNWSFKGFFFLLLGVLLGFSLNFIEPSSENHNLWFVFLCGIIGVSGMAIPGLSGSFILMLMGNYVFLLVDTVNVFGEIITKLILGNFSILHDKIQQQYLLIMVVFTLGSVFGLIFLSKMLRLILTKWDKEVNALIIGFIIGSLGVVWPWKQKIYAIKNGAFVLDTFSNRIVVGFEKFFPSLEVQQNLIATFFIITGLLLVLLIERFSNKNKI